MNNKAIPISIVVVIVIALALVIAGGNQNKPPANQPIQQNATTGGTTTGSTQGQYKDGTYTVTSNYTSPAGAESVGITLTVKADTITAVSINKLAENTKSKYFQDLFSEGISESVVGKKLNAAQVSKINGSSITSGGYNTALAQIIVQATI